MHFWSPFLREINKTSLADAPAPLCVTENYIFFNSLNAPFHCFEQVITFNNASKCSVEWNNRSLLRSLRWSSRSLFRK